MNLMKYESFIHWVKTSISHVDYAHRRLFLLMTFLKYYWQNVHIITQHKTFIKILINNTLNRFWVRRAPPGGTHKKRQSSRLMHFPALIPICLCVQVFRSSITAWPGSSVQSSVSYSPLWLVQPAIAALCHGAGGDPSSWPSVWERWWEWLCFWMARY